MAKINKKSTLHYAASEAKQNKKKRKKNHQQSLQKIEDPIIDENEQRKVLQTSKKKRKKNDKIHQNHTKKNEMKHTSKTLNDGEGNSSSNKQKSKNNLSLASKLKRERGTAATTSLPPTWKPPVNNNDINKLNVLSPEKDGIFFDSCKEQCYKGFHWEKPEQLPPTFHNSFSKAFNELNKYGLFLYDAVQPGKKRLSRTMVTRTLVGEPGSTYKYLGLRLFSHPWCDDDGKSLAKMGYTKECANALYQIGELNQFLINRTNNVLNREIKPNFSGTVGSAEYSLTLINRMEPSSIKSDLRNENIYGLGKTSVSWHKDSGLQDFSSIAVYHTLQEYDTIIDNNRSAFDLQHFNNNSNSKVSKMRKMNKGKNNNKSSSESTKPWKVALRIADPNNTTPALAVPLPSGSLYYLLDDFNHQHEHAVITGSNKLRYSSTHRVARAGCGTWSYLDDKCNVVVEILESYLENINAEKKNPNRKRQTQLSKDVRSQQQLMTEIEFEWIRQWYIQGRHHADLHTYWHEPMKKLEQTLEKIQSFTTKLIKIFKLISSPQLPEQFSEIEKAFSTLITVDVIDILIEAFTERQKRQLVWNERLNDPIFSTMPDKMKPFSCSVLLSQNQIDLKSLVVELRKSRSSFINNQQVEGSSSTKSRKNKNKLSMTKKEQKLVASNWERMKSLMKS